MELNGVVGYQEIRKVNNGVKPEEISKALKNNNLKEIVVQNDTGTYIIAGKDLEVRADYLEKGKDIVTNLTRKGQVPAINDKIDFGELQGTIIATDNNYDPTVDSESRKKGVKMSAGAFIGGIVVSVASVVASEKGTSIAAESRVAGNGIMGFVVGAVVGLGVGYLAHRVSEKPVIASVDINATKIKNISTLVE
jgi:hypothetical protein